MKPSRCINCSAVVEYHEPGTILPVDTKWLSLQLPGGATLDKYRPCLCNLCRAEIPRVVMAMFEHYSRMLVQSGIDFESLGSIFKYQLDEEGGDEPCESITEREGEPPTDRPDQVRSNSEQREGGIDAPT